jgi:hypothetical protein
MTKYPNTQTPKETTNTHAERRKGTLWPRYSLFGVRISLGIWVFRHSAFNGTPEEVNPVPETLKLVPFSPAPYPYFGRISGWK